MKTGLPVKAGWRNGSIKHFLKKMDEGSKDTGAVSPLKNLLFQPLLYRLAPCPYCFDPL